MPYSIRTFDRPGKFCRDLGVDALARAIPEATIAAAMAETGAVARRERKLTMAVVVWALIAMNLYSTLSMGHVLGKLARGRRYVWPDPDYRAPGASALSYRRYQLGARPLAAVFHRTCRPPATPATPGAFLFGLRLLSYRLTDPARPGHGEVHRLVTTLTDPAAAPALDLICAYHERWEFELAVDELATHQRHPGRPLRSKCPVGAISHYAVRALMREAAVRADLAPDRLSFVHAAIPEFQQTAPAGHPRPYARLLRDLAAVVLPARRPRSNPRVRKRTGRKFHRKRPGHAHWPQPATPFRDAVALI